MEHDVGTKFEMWREADRTAHEAELQIRSFGKRYGHLVPEKEGARARELRQSADRLFDEAMIELSIEVGKAHAKQSAASG